MKVAVVVAIMLALSPCKQECERQHKACLNAAPVTGATLLDCINVYYRCAEQCEED